MNPLKSTSTTTPDLIS